MEWAFPNWRGELFGRDEDIAYLIGRARQRGVTAVVGRAQMGKTTLLKEVQERLSTAEAGRILQERPCLVGYVESVGRGDDLLLRATADLYTRWLEEDSVYPAQARVVVEQHRKDFVSAVGEAVGSLFERVSKLGSKPTEVVGGIVNETFKGLAGLNRDLKSGRLELPPLHIDQARELLEIVYKVTERRAVLIFDRWELSNLTEERNILDAFVRHMEEWPPCHIFVGTQGNEEVNELLEGLEGQFPFGVNVYPLPLMRFGNSEERRRFLGFLHESVPVAKEVSDERLEEMIAGYPGVVARWTQGYAARRVNTVADLERLTEEAHRNLYSEFNQLFADLSEAQRLFCMRVSMLPASSDGEFWPYLKEIVTEGVKASERDDLMQNQVMVSISPPSYGHAKRTEAAFRWLEKNRREEFEEVCEELIYKLGGRIQTLASDEFAFGYCLNVLAPLSESLSLPVMAQGMCEAARTLLGEREIDGVKLVSACRMEPGKGSMSLIAIGVANALRTVASEGNIDVAEVLLGELMHLYNRYQENTEVRRSLSSGFFQVLEEVQRRGDTQRRDDLLDDLRYLQQRYTDDKDVLGYLAMILCNSLGFGKEAGDLEYQQRMLKELEELQQRYPEDAVVRESFAKGLVNTLNDRERQEELLERLRGLERDYPKDTGLREWLYKGLYIVFSSARDEGEAGRRDEMLEEQRQLQQRYPEDGRLREHLAHALCMLHVQQGNDAKLRHELLEEMRLLQQRYPQDVKVRESFALGLFTTLMHAEQERREALVKEIRDFHGKYPDDSGTQGPLAGALVFQRSSLSTKADSRRRDELLEELRQLRQKYPENAVVRERLAVALSDVVWSGKSEAERLDALEELRSLQQTYGEDTDLRPVFTNCLAKAFTEAFDNGDRERATPLWAELCELADNFPADSHVVGLVETLHKGMTGGQANE